MSSLAQWVLLANSGQALIAAVVNLIAAKFAPHPSPWRVTRSLVAAFATLYSVAYLWLFITQDPVEWSETMRGVSLLSWPIVWIAPAVIEIRTVLQVRKAGNRILEEQQCP